MDNEILTIIVFTIVAIICVPLAMVLDVPDDDDEDEGVIV